MNPSLLFAEFHVDCGSRAVGAAIKAIAGWHQAASKTIRRSAGIDWTGRDRRRVPRAPARIPLLIWPADYSQGQVLLRGDEAGIAVTRDLSIRGFALLCDQPVLAEYAVAEFDGVAESGVRLLLEIRWTRRKGPFAYVLGAQAIGVIEGDPLCD